MISTSDALLIIPVYFGRKVACSPLKVACSPLHALPCKTAIVVLAIVELAKPSAYIELEE